MQVGDLVRVLVGDREGNYPLGLVIGFDEDDDPIVIERGAKREHYRKHIEVINESKNR